MGNRCIYCDASEDLSESDIIPDALTNARILNRNVCRIQHNNKFSDLFESKVIAAIAFITNELDIKSSKGKKYASYDATVTIEGEEYKASLHNDKEIFDGRVLKSEDKSHMLSSYDRIVRIAKDENLVQPIDVNHIELEKKVKINTAIYYDEAIFRMVSKIAFEWYCAKNEVIGYHEEFKNIISFITTGDSDNPVSIVQVFELYDMLSQHLNMGSHSLFAYESSTGKIEVIVSLFGLIMYRVVVADAKPSFCKKNFLFAELCTDSSRKEIVHESREAAEEKLSETLIPQKFISAGQINGVQIMIPRNYESIIDVSLYTFLFNLISCFDGNRDDTTVPTEQLNIIFNKQLDDVLQSSLLHKKSIKRFVNEYFSEGHEKIQINPYTSNRKTTMMFYVVFIVGMSGIDKLDDSSFLKLLRDNLNIQSGETFKITEEVEELQKSKMLDTDGYSEILEKGAAIIKEWIN